MIGSKLSHYEITGHLGSGGMGDVYQATDTKLGRSVAIKFLSEGFSHDDDRLARFEREARVLATLNNPHIAGIYGLEESGESKFLVMELVNGETLAERIKRGPIPIDESLRIAKDICQALEAAHEKGIIHRDLKPANVKITPDGTVKVLDFGLAKTYEAETSKANVSQSPTLSMAATNAGMILGTAAYMSPEQAKGRHLDARTDIFSFGVVLYEMLTGRPAFDGDDVQDILGAVLRTEPDWSHLPAELSPAIRRLLRLCLEKNAKNRRSHATDVRLDIEQALTEPAAAVAPLSRGPRLPWILATAAVLAAALLAIPAFRYLRETPSEGAPETRLEIVTPATAEPASFALSPDGRQIVFVASGDGPSRLWLRRLDSTTAQALAGTEGATFPFWSPDNRSIGFAADAKMKRIDIGGGAPQILAAASGFRGGTWSADGVILFAPTATAPLFRIPASGGEPVALTKVNRQTSHRFPFFLPDGRQFLFLAQGSADTAGIYIGMLDSAETRRLTQADTPAVYLPSGWMLWVRDGTLTAQRLDLERKEMLGDSVILADSLATEVRTGATALSVSGTGRLAAYRTGEASQWQLTWFDHSGKKLGTLDEPPGNLINIELAPDELRVAADRILQKNRDIWLVTRGRTTRFTFDAGSDMNAHWSPDESRIVFRSDRKGVWNLYQKAANGAGNDEILLESPLNKFPTAWSSDGRFLLYVALDPKTKEDLWVLPMEGDRKPFPFLNGNFVETIGQFSPDSRWVSYQSDESGRQEIYVRPFPVRAGQWQISTAGGIQARWSHDGKELYYIDPTGRLMATPITVKGDSIEPGTPVPLFQTRIWGGTANTIHHQYAVTRDGRFLINTTLDDAFSPITLIQNWRPPAK
jgi:eukaryotic-like serine/threonine-protein kinase